MGELIDAAESGAPPLEQQASRQLSAGPSESHMGHGHSARRRFVNKLRRQRTELESAAAAALAAEAVAASGKSKSGGVGRSGPSLGASSMGTLDADVAGEFWQAGAPADVEAGQGQGPTVPADVWHADG